ncbi:uncharacterized protein JCM6883_003361 [Sporobolomyces salmoneus]|uniref:uncharacterized protein n=1 Tax=Sporobolomyces salmoneus TaxID=183962 RepID=UPI00317BA48A
MYTTDTTDSFICSSPTSYSSPLWFPPPRRSSSSEMSLSTASPYASMEIPSNVEMVRRESHELQQLQLREIELAAANNMVGAALDLHVREKDKAEVAKLKQAATAGGGYGPKT